MPKHLWWYAWIGFVCLSALVMYWPALNAPFFADDYIYLDATRQLDSVEYLEASFEPRHSDQYLILAKDFWRPLYFASFAVLEPLFGGEPAGYHLVNLVSHLAAIVLVALLAVRFTGRWEPGLAAGAVFGVHPAAFEAVAWVSSLNSVAVPLGLASWLTFERAVPPGERAGRRWLAASVCLMALALGFRETAVTFVPAIGLWYLACRAGRGWRQPRSWAPLLPFAVLLAVHHVLRTRFLAEPATVEGLYEFDGSVFRQSWEMLSYGLYPFGYGEDYPGSGILASAVLLVALAWAAYAHRWLPLVLFAGFIAMVTPFVVLAFGMGPRYFYGPSALFALVVGALVAEAIRWTESRGYLRTARQAGAVALAAWLVFCVVTGQHQVQGWEEDGPARVDAFVSELRHEHPQLPPGGTLYVANAPLELVLFEAANLLPTVRYYYPALSDAELFNVAEEAAVRQRLGPADRVFIFDG